MNTGIVNIRGKEYMTVALRVQHFREVHPDWSIVTQIVHRDADEVVMVATILNEQNRIIATGHAEEKRKASQINSTSALENCETSAIGRALAGAGFGGSEFASANEVQNAIQQQPAVDKAINAIKEAGSMEALKIVYTAAIRQFKSESDLAKINAAKDARKAEL
jgi:deoxycytidylate deaminase